jgi:hypothetical protein
MKNERGLRGGRGGSKLGRGGGGGSITKIMAIGRSPTGLVSLLTFSACHLHLNLRNFEEKNIKISVKFLTVITHREYVCFFFIKLVK